MTATCAPPIAHIDEALDDLYSQRQHLRHQPSSAGRSLRIANLYEQEARLWSALFEHTRTRVHWRAALVAELHARHCASLWRRHAHGETPMLPQPTSMIRGRDDVADALSSHGNPGGAP